MAKQDIPVRSVQPPSSLKLTQHLSYRRLVMLGSSKINSRLSDSHSWCWSTL